MNRHVPRHLCFVLVGVVLTLLTAGVSSLPGCSALGVLLTPGMFLAAIIFPEGPHSDWPMTWLVSAGLIDEFSRSRIWQCSCGPGSSAFTVIEHYRETHFSVTLATFAIFVIQSVSPRHILKLRTWPILQFWTNGKRCTRRWWEAEPDGRVHCYLCPRHCHIDAGQAGFCFIRINQDGKLYSLGYARLPLCKSIPSKKSR